MISEVHLLNWKSFDDATLHVDPLTVVIGNNSSGKSNLLDALSFLSRIASGSMTTAALQGDSSLSPLRGGIEWAPRKPGTHFAIGVKITVDPYQELEYLIGCQVTGSRCEIDFEQLDRRLYRRKANGERGAAFHPIRLFWTDSAETDSPTIGVRLYNEKGGTLRQLGRNHPVIYQLAGQKTRIEIAEGVDSVSSALRGIFILDAIPSHMRGFSPLADQLDPDAGNIGGVLAGLPDAQKKAVEDTITRYVSQLPEKDIFRVYAETVGRFKSDAMLYCEEKFANDDISVVDARGMSDGTLRFIGILTALLTRPRGSLLIVEEVDNGLHPSRSQLLLDVLRDIGKERNVDVVVTTHNPALLDAMGTSMVPFITVAHRDPNHGTSELTLLEQVDRLPKLLAQGLVGRLSSQGLLEAALREQELSAA